MNENLRKKIALVVISVCVAVLTGFGFYETNKDKSTGEIIENAVEEVKEQISTYEMTEEEIKELPSTEIVEKTAEEEQKVSEEQEVEAESFELQGEIAYEGDTQYEDITLGGYIGLTYYSQIDSRWSSHPYTSVGDNSQTIGSSGCGPACRSNGCNSYSWCNYTRPNGG